MDSPSRPRSLPWTVPSTIVVSFLAAIVLAFGHHMFYRSLDGTLVRTAMFDQQYNVAIGTGFAFLVRALLVLSIGTTYWQVFWRTLRSQTLTVSNIDALFSLLHNAFSFVKVRSLFRHPLLVCIAFLSWTVPLAIVVPPATLSVKSDVVTFHESKFMNIPSFNATNMAHVSQAIGDEQRQANVGDSKVFPGCDHNGNFLLYNSPSQPLSRMTIATAYQGNLPRIDVPATNASYTLSFNAPATRCENAPKSIISQLGVIDPFGDAMGRPNYYYTYEYMSWVPTKSALVPSYVKGKGGGFSGQIQFNDISGVAFNRTGGFSSYLGQYENLPPSLFIAYGALRQPEAGEYVWYALNCSFYNATYTVDFKFPNGEQKISISSVEFLEDSLKLSIPIWKSCKNGTDTHRFLTDEQVGYQAMIETLGRALVGTISFSEGLFQTTSLVVDQTSVMKTNLAFSNELRPLYAIGMDINNSGDAPPWEIVANATVSQVPKTGLTLAASIEQLFHNMTLSLFADKSMLIASSSPSNVTRSVIENVYSYSWKQLVLAYGVALFVTMVTVILGCFILVANGAAYSSDFSTFMRLIRGQHIDDVVLEHDDRDGADPLPEALAKAKIHIDSNARREQSLLKERQIDGTGRKRVTSTH